MVREMYPNSQCDQCMTKNVLCIGIGDDYTGATVAFCEECYPHLFDPEYDKKEAERRQEEYNEWQDYLAKEKEMEYEMKRRQLEEDAEFAEAMRKTDEYDYLCEQGRWEEAEKMYLQPTFKERMAQRPLWVRMTEKVLKFFRII